MIEKYRHDTNKSMMARSVQPSVHGKLIDINYMLEIYIKHDAWNEWGKGKLVTLPIKIMMPVPSSMMLPVGPPLQN